VRFVRIAVVEKIHGVDLTLTTRGHSGDFDRSSLQAVGVLDPGLALRRGLEVARCRIQRQAVDQRDRPDDEAERARDGQGQAVAHTAPIQRVEVCAGAGRPVLARKLTRAELPTDC